jgi:2,4-dichlorophenol 6-monooxygenase
VLKGEAGPGLLDSYEQERRAVTARNVDWALMTFKNHAVFDVGIGLIPNAPVEVNREQFRIFFSDTPAGATRRALLNEVAKTQRIEFQAHDIEIGFYYETGALVSDGTAAPPRDPMGGIYHPTTRPGHRMPHAWIERGGKRVSTHDLVDGSRFVLITGDAAGWSAAAQDGGAPIAVEEVNDAGWRALSEIEKSGAVLVRPDGHIGWRAKSAPADRGAVLKSAVKAILAR